MEQDVYLLCIVIFTGLTCQHVSKAVDLNSVKKTVLSSVWFVCSDCLKERTIIDSEPGASNDIVVCLKCGFQVIVLILTHISKGCLLFHSSLMTSSLVEEFILINLKRAQRILFLNINM